MSGRERIGIGGRFMQEYAIRQYLPKGVDLSPATQEYLNKIAMALNCRPRKALNWQTPLEAFSQLVDYHSAFKSVAPHV